jgi:hypothetical protein
VTEAPVVVDGSALLGRARKAWGPFRHGGMTGVGLSGLRRRTPAGWTFGALAAHVAAWHLLTAERLERFAETGEPTPPPDDVDAFNADVARRAEGRLPTELIDELDRSWQRIEAVVPRLTGEQVAASDGWAEAVIAGNTYDHYEEHREELRSARPRTVDDLLGRFDADWRVLRDAVATLDSADWGEADPASALEFPGCHFTTGMFADFFGRIADHPLSVLEVECRSMGAPRCRFLLGNVEVMEHVYEEMGRGVGYEEAVREVE